MVLSTWDIEREGVLVSLSSQRLFGTTVALRTVRGQALGIELVQLALLSRHFLSQ